MGPKRVTKLAQNQNNKYIYINKIPCYPSLRVYASPGPRVTSSALG